VLKGKSFGKFLKLRDLAKTFIRIQGRDGRSIFLWHDHWHPLGYLLDKFGFRVVYDSRLSMDAKLSSIILMVIGTGQELGPKLWWIFNVSFRRFHFQVLILLFGTQAKALFLMQKHGK